MSPPRVRMGEPVLVMPLKGIPPILKALVPRLTITTISNSNAFCAVGLTRHSSALNELP